MRFYRIDWRDDFEPTALQTDWATTIREAERIAREESTAIVRPVEVPTDKAGLLAFLKQRIRRPDR